jgi:diguanylate cyclase (GGDEF)-like protein/putative nucleotidyltransferase with HDIG domain
LNALETADRRDRGRIVIGEASIPWKAKLYIGAVVSAGFCCFVYATSSWTCRDPREYLCCLAIAVLASTSKVRLPGATGAISVSSALILLSMVEFSYAETMVLACLAMAVQTGWRVSKRTKLVHFLFNCSAMALAVSAGCAVYRLLAVPGKVDPLALTAATTGFFLMNTFPVAGVIALTEGKGALATWRSSCFWSFAYYLAGAAAAGVISLVGRRIGWEAPFLALPMLYIMFRSFRLYMGKVESEKQHAEKMAAVHLRTVEALALAIETKDANTQAHLQRVPVYALDLGEKLGLDLIQLQALRAASILHDVGKLAVPEYIITKPGKLTPEEFDQMKIHPVVGAEIVARIEFPYPVAPIVRAHHERWNGTGYPDGLRGEQIPIGARILAAADCLDALTSDRPYRGAMQFDEAMAVVAGESGISYDPRVVECLRQNYKTWEKLALAQPVQAALHPKPASAANAAHGHAPATGFEALNLKRSGTAQPDFRSSVAMARQEFRMLHELTQDPGNSLNLHETLAVIDIRLRGLIPYDAIIIYARNGDRLVPVYVNREDFRPFSALEIPIGQGLAGWVAETGKSIVNANPCVEPGYPDDATKFSTLRSALAVPLLNAEGITGVLALYRAGRDAFSQQHLRVLEAVKAKVSLSMENALNFQQASISAATDGLTGLPDARSLFLHLDGELDRCKQNHTESAVLVCDLDRLKQVNEHFGRPEGNKVLKLVAAGLQHNCREYDYVARMGGDEFVLVLPGLKPCDLPGKLDALGEAVADAGVAACGERLLALRAGAAFFPQDGTDVESLLAEADRRMCLVKRCHKVARSNTAYNLAALAVRIEQLETSHTAD